MKKIIKITYEALQIIDFAILNNLRNFAFFLNCFLPYLMLFIGEKIYQERQGIGLGGELLIPIIFFFFIYLITTYADSIGKGIKMPTPTERFTTIDKRDGTVSISEDKIEELILYTADLEEWMERNGLI